MSLTTKRAVASIKIEYIQTNLLSTHQIKLRPLDETKVNEIAASIRAKGLKQPILVRKLSEGGYRVVFGDHRLVACRRAGLEIIPCIVDSIADESTELEVKVIENIQRNHFVDPAVEGLIFDRLLRDKESKYHSVNELADGIGKPLQYVKDRLSVHENLHPDLKKLIGLDLTIQSAIALSRHQPDKQKALAGLVISAKKSNFVVAGTRKNNPRPRCVCPNCGMEHWERSGAFG